MKLETAKKIYKSLINRGKIFERFVDLADKRYSVIAESRKKSSGAEATTLKRKLGTISDLRRKYAAEKTESFYVADVLGGVIRLIESYGQTEFNLIVRAVDERNERAARTTRARLCSVLRREIIALAKKNN